MSDDDIIETLSVPSTRPRRITFEEESTQPRLSRMCVDALVTHPGCHVAAQESDTCLVHAIINATQRHDKMRDMLREIRTVDGLHRKDVTAAVEVARRLLGIRISNGFDAEKDDVGIAHVYMTDGEGHFIALKRIDGVLHVLDSLNGKMATLHNLNHLWTRCTPYAISRVT